MRGIKYYSGIAGYSKEFQFSGDLNKDSELYLDLGTVHDIARQLAKSGTANVIGNGLDDEGELKKGIKPKRERGDRETVRSTVRARPFYWYFLERGLGPDGEEHAFMLRALQEMRPNMDRIYLEAFVKKLQARLARERKRQGG